MTAPPGGARTLDALALAGLVALVLGPLLVGRGFPMVGDMVFVPDQPWKDAWLGLDGSAPRFVPGEALVWSLGAVGLDELGPRLLLGTALAAAGWGARSLVSERVLAARWTAMAVIVWNPWVLERLAIGQWPLVVGLAALVWVVRGALTARLAGDGLTSALVWGLVVAGVACPPAGVMAAVTALALVVGGGARLVLRTGCVALAANLAWLVPSAVGSGAGSAPAGQFAAFALSAETPAGAWLSALSGGGIWKTSIVPAERELLLLVVVAALAAVGAVIALLASTGQIAGPQRSVARRLVAGSFAALLLAVLLGTGFGAEAADAAAQQFGALGFFRDSHRWLAPWVVAIAWGAGVGVDWLWHHRRRGDHPFRLLAGAAPALPLIVLPSLVWGISNTLRPVQYPAEWSQVQQLDPKPTVVLPWTGTYRGFAWNGLRAVLDPAPRMLGGTVLIDDRIFLSGDRVLASEDPRLAAVADALSSADPAEALRAVGIERVLVEKGQGVNDDQVPDGQVVHDGEHLMVVDLGPATGTMDRALGAGARALVLLGDAAVLLVVGVAVRLSRRRSRRRDDDVRAAE